MKIRMTLKDAINSYGEVKDGVWADEAKHCGLLQIPDEVAAVMINSATGKPTAHIYCNMDMAPSLLRAFFNVKDRGFLHELKTFDGCLMVRDIRGLPGEVSAHAYAMAVDLNANENPLGGPVRFSIGFRKCFEDEGFTSGADFHRVDGMHFSFLGW